MSALENLIELLQLVRDESMDCEIAENLTEKIEWSSLLKLGEVYCNLFHYWADEDIRGRDSVYKEFQNNELVKLISHLKKQGVWQSMQYFISLRNAEVITNKDRL